MSIQVGSFSICYPWFHQASEILPARMPLLLCGMLVHTSQPSLPSPPLSKAHSQGFSISSKVKIFFLEWDEALLENIKQWPGYSWNQEPLKPWFRACKQVEPTPRSLENLVNRKRIKLFTLRNNSVFVEKMNRTQVINNMVKSYSSKGRHKYLALISIQKTIQIRGSQRKVCITLFSYVFPAPLAVREKLGIHPNFK